MCIYTNLNVCFNLTYTRDIKLAEYIYIPLLIYRNMSPFPEYLYVAVVHCTI